MNAKPEQIQTSSNVDAPKKNNLIAPDASATGLTEVTNDELDQVEGGTAVVHADTIGGIGTRTGYGSISIFRKG